ncbi:PE-PPE domain-containing protein [Mycolicibacterium novocastrense]|uniref:PE-PPE domain-containing protein n=1 Tax=Mycolicibacterium novocastrense TaxID=59813 RepID=UPI003908A9EB
MPGWCDPGRCEKFDVSVADGVKNLNEVLAAMERAGYDGDLVIAGYSQGSRVVTISKMQFASGQWKDLVDSADSIEFVYIGNPNRPNGGILSRFGILGHIPILDVTTGQPTPTNTPFETKDWAIRWEGIADFPQYLLNPLAILNSVMGFYYDHGTYLAINGKSDPGETPAGYTVAEWKELTTYPEKHPDLVQIQKLPNSDTTYYTVRPKVLPLVRPLHSIPLIGKPIADFWEPILEVLIEETGYNRNIPFGQYSPIGLIPFFNPITLVLRMIPAVFQGVVNFLGNFIPSLAPKPIEITPEPATTSLAPGSDEDDSLDNEVENLADAGENQGDNLRRFAARGDAEGTVLAVTGNGELALTAGAEDPAITDPAEGEIITDPNAGEVIEGEELPGAVLEPIPISDPEIVEEKMTDPADGNALVAVKDPEVKKDPEGQMAPQLKSNLPQNRIDANGRSVSLNASPNQSGETPKDAGNGAVQKITAPSPEPSEGLTTKPEPTGAIKDAQDADDADVSQDSEPAAA